MKKLLTFLMMFILSISVGWADEYSWTLSSTNFVTKNGTSTSGGTTTQNSVSWDFSASEYVSSENGTGGKGVQFGSKNNPDATFTLSTTGIPGTITKVDVEASAYSSSATIGVSVGGTSYGSSNLGTTNSTKSFSGSSSGKIIITLTNASSGGRAMYLKSIKVTYSTGGSQATSHDITYAEVTGGTFTGPTSAVEGAEVTIQATPDDGYNFGSWNVTDASGAIIVTDNKFTMGTSNVTVSGTFVAKPTHTVSVTNGIADPEEAYEGQTVTLTPTIPDGKVVDWDNTTVSPSLEINHSDYTFTMPGQAVTVVFTFKDAPTYTNIFERITSIEQLEAGKRYLLVYENDNKAAGTTEGTHKYLSSQSVTIQNNSITLDDNSSAIPFTLSGSTDTYKLADPDGRFITPTAAKSLILDASGNVTASITFSSNNVVINFGSTYGIMYYNTSDPRFLNYTSTQASIQLYKEVEEEVTVDDLYLIGYGMNGTEGWNLTTAPQMTYSTSAGTYAVDVYFDKAQRGMFQFAKGLSSSNDNWSGLTGRLYPSTNGSNVSVDAYDMDGTVGLYFTDNSNMYSFELPAGLYTITANLGEWKTYVTQKPVTMTINPASTYINGTRNVTMESNLTDLGGKIYYTTDGSNPKEQSNSNRHEYTGTITLDATTTIKAVAVLGCIYSEIVENTYTKLPATPKITPASCTFYEPLTVTITAEEGATIYYTTDGNNPNDQSTQYTGPFTVSTTTTVKAKAYVGEFYSNGVAEETYTYRQITTSTLADLEANPVEGESYRISDELTVGYVADDGTAYAKDADQDIKVPAGAHDYVATMLTNRSHTNKTANWIAITGLTDVNLTEGSRLTNVVGTLTDAVNFTLAVSQQPELSNPHVGYDVNTYIPCNFMGQSTQTGTNGQTYFFSTPQVNEFAHITNAVLASKTSGTSGEAGTYTMTIDGNDNGNKDVHWTSDATSLTWDEITWNTSITWQKSGTYFNNGKEFAQIGSGNNPAATISMSTTGFGGKRITGVSFRASCTNTYGPTLTVTAGSQTLLTDIPILKSTDAGEDTYSTNSANVMMGENDALTFTINSSAEAGLYIYSLSVTYDDATGATGTFNLGTGAGVNTAGLSGEITVDLGSLGDSFTVGQMYTFNALIKTAASDNGAPRRVAGNGNYSIQAVGNVSGNDITTAVDELQSGKAVDGVRYVNVAGQVAATPWQGVNIVVTRYTDGSTRTTKVVK